MILNRKWKDVFSPAPDQTQLLVTETDVNEEPDDVIWSSYCIKHKSGGRKNIVKEKVREYLFNCEVMAEIEQPP